ncbi:rab geranylgeranyltransferase [Phaffia rhodozyma]|uniref:Geranylgeranyl transferase type-2 subunit beta n=1 Tax=Phaffia rhodozyma TaxID=264483 RepID=A0A0F7SIN7_PHARH|nr:rab geranylgeranyltransferase [Phaffia rhodozyma]
MIDWVMSCWNQKQGGFGSSPKHDAHAHSTLSAIQILITQDAFDRLDIEAITSFYLSLQNPTTGSFAGDSWGETDTRFTYIAVSALSLLGTLDRLNREKTISWLRRCRNFDGGFGSGEGGESHGSQVFVCVGALAILDALETEVDVDILAGWLAERQLPNGGMNGRPEKLEDVCYSFWNLSALSILGKLHWIDQEKLIKFILDCQDLEGGGIGDRPENMVDVFHTIFGLAGLSILGYKGLDEIDPVYCMPASVIDRVGLRKPYQIGSRPDSDHQVSSVSGEGKGSEVK